MYYNGSDYVWYLSIKDGYKDSYKSRKRNMLAKKLEGIFNGECDIVKHNGTTYEMNATPFRVDGYPVYLVYRVGEKAPCFLWYHKEEGFSTDYIVIVDEDMSLFEEYGYVVERHGEILEDYRK